MAEERDSQLDGRLLALVGLAAFVAYALCATLYPYPLDSAELATASFGLGVAHPPGEETSLLWGKLFTCLPLGTVAFRVALSQAVAGAVAVALVFRLVLDVGQRLPILAEGFSPWLRRVVASASALAFAFAPGMVLSCDRPEVYATQAALSLGALWLALRGFVSRDPRWFALAAIALGLGVGNHSLVAGLVGVGAVALAVPPLLASGTKGRFILCGVGAFAAGLVVHAYLPLRSAALLSGGGLDQVAWGDARTWRGFWWVVSARTFAQKNSLVQGNASPWDLPFLPMEELEPPLVLMALVGVYLLLRRSGGRAPGLGLLLGCLGSLAAALWGGMDPMNPDTRGYLLPAFALLAVFSGVALSAGVAVFRVARLRWPLALLFLVGALSRFPATGAYPGLRGAKAADLVAGRLLDDLPLRSALFTNHFETGFLLGYQRAIEGRRPDVEAAHLAFAGGPGYRDRVARSAPGLLPVVEAFRSGIGQSGALRALADRRPVRFEPDVITPEETRGSLAPAGEFWSPDGESRLPSQLPDVALAEAATDRQVRGFLAFRLFVDAAWSCDHGVVERARLRFADLQRLVPKDARLLDLRRRCPLPANP